MAYTNELSVIALAELPAVSARMKEAGAHFVQMHCILAKKGFDIIYTWMDGAVLKDFKIEAITAEDVVPSITGDFLAAFVFENEAHDLFGVNIKDIAIDFQGKFYNLSTKTPMAFMSEEKKVALEQAAKVAAAKAAKEAKAKAAAEGETKASAAAGGIDADMEAKLAAMDPEKAAKVRAAMEAKAKKEAAAKAAQAQDELEAKLAGMDPEKAAKVRAAMEAKAKREAAAKDGE